MTGNGTITTFLRRRLRAATVILALWQLLVCVLGVWWGSLLLRQGKRIAELEGALGVSRELSTMHFLRTQRMLYWEFSVYVLLLVGSTAFLSWVYYRDLKRTRAMRSFFAAFTHELRTPLTSIRLQAESIAESASDPKPLIARLLEDTSRLESQVDKTLELARVEGGGPVFTQPLRLKPWIERIARSWAETYARRLELRVQLEDVPEDVAIEADPVALQIVFRNLVENAFRHSGRENLVVTITARRAPGSVELFFRDNGNGFTGTDVRLGTLFAKGPASQGAGVGLYLVKVLVERMNGAVSFGNAKNDGKTLAGFEARLRLQEAVEHV
ncbi:MAG: HAMP domain-containing histidine kinase [Deltaproteobacteria bacterium]|nr:HAMP domain-containing histidine kinase [Deltaproteobacteria bacterium]